MKAIITTTLVLLTVSAGAQKTAQTATVSGTVEGGNSPYVLCVYNVETDNMATDTLPIRKDGFFTGTVKIDKAGPAYIIYPDAGNTMLFLEDGGDTSANIKISGDKSQPTYELLSLTGTNSEFPQLWQGVERISYEAWPFGRISKMSFADYRKGLLAETDSIKAEVNKAKSLTMRRWMLGQIDAMLPSSLFRYAWSDAPKNDPDFVAFAESLDRNDPENSEDASRYLRWHMKRHPLPKTGNRTIEYFKVLEQVFQNKEVIDIFATESMEAEIKNAPADMDESFAYYKTFVNDTAEISRLQPLFDHYVRLKTGSKAADFTMTDEKGKTWKLSDFRGRAVYIDCWATWCGPCCMEIPYMEKLYDKLKKDKRVELISVSLDNNKAAWTKKLKADKPGWKQFICPDNFKSTLAKNYDIDAIPRFLFFDKNGCVISLDAPRPSDEGILEYITSKIAPAQQ